MGKPVQSGLKQMSRSKPAKGCGVGGHVVGWQGQLTDGPVNARSRPKGRTMSPNGIRPEGITVGGGRAETRRPDTPYDGIAVER
jgi:hypothetical protein